MNEPTPKPTSPRALSGEVQSSFRIAGMIVLWAVCFAGGSQVIARDLLAPGLLRWGVALLPSGVGVLVIWGYVRFLRESDELQRVIQLRALALAFAGTFFAMTGYGMVERMGAPSIDCADYTVLMAILYSVGSLLGWSRYR